MPNEPLATYRRLERRTSNRVIGGVAGGLADYLNVDPLLIRVGFAGLMLFSGAGIPLYLLGWLFIPLAGHQDGIAMGWLRSLTAKPATVIVLGVLAILLFASFPVYRRLDDFGWYVLGGFRVTPQIQVIARQEDFQRPAIEIGRRVRATTLGAVLEIAPNRVRLMIDGVRRMAGAGQRRMDALIGQI